jgi:transcriptional regulator with XRE-family HTH domain
MSEFGSELKRQRTERQLSQSALARRVGVHPSYISRIERGKRDPGSRKLVETLAEALKASMSDKNSLLLAAGFAPVTVSDLREEDSALQLVAGVLEDDTVPKEEKELIIELIRLIDRRQRQTDLP